MDEQKLRGYYKSLSFKFLIAAVLLVVMVIALMVVNKWYYPVLSMFQLVCLTICLAALLISIGFHLQYRSLLNDPLSSVGDNPAVSGGGKKPFSEIIADNRKMVYNNNGLFYIGLVFLIIVCIGWLLPKDRVQCDTSPTQVMKNFLSDSALYALAIKYANTPGEEKICKTLVAINANTIDSFEPDSVKNKKYIRVYAAKDSDYYSKKVDSNKFYNTQQRELWVFTKEDFFNKYKLSASEDSVYRIKQLLGLPPNKQIKYIVSFLVDTLDLFRPCLDPEINDSQCQLTIASVLNSDHVSYVKNWYKDAYLGTTQYPFTELGYTFDWNPYNFSHVGVSEFIIDKYKDVKLDTVMNVTDFLRKGMKGYK